MNQTIIDKINEIINTNNRFNLIKEKITNNCFSDYQIKNINNSIYIGSFNNKNNETDCSVCYYKNINILNCNHSLCNSCLHKWNKVCISNSVITTCPICRTIITT